MRVTGLFVYPIKSCGAIALDQAVVTSTGEHREAGRTADVASQVCAEVVPPRGAGLSFDRRWMVIDAESGWFVTQVRGLLRSVQQA